MKIAIVAPSATPFVIGGAEKLWWGLQHQINTTGNHAVELIKLPSPEQDFWSLMQSYQQFSELNLDHFDRVITTKYPAWMITHKEHIVYLQHRLRGLYDCYPDTLPLDPFTQAMPQPLREFLQWVQQQPTTKAHLPQFWQKLFALKPHTQHPHWQPHFTLPSAVCRFLIHHLDNIALHPSQIKAYYAISNTVAQRENYFPEQVMPQVIPHPSDITLTPSHTYHPYIFTASRLDSPKRIDLIIQAYAKANITLPLKIAGTGPQQQQLQQLINQLHLQDRIQLLGYVSDQAMAQYYQNAQFIVYIPYDEDMGLITIEAMQAAKAVLTMQDTGGVKEFIRHQENGWITQPNLTALAKGLHTLATQPKLCQTLGQNAYQDSQSITWQSVVRTLTQNPIKQPSKPAMLVVNTFNCYPVDSGGKARMYHLYHALSAYYDITMIVLAEVNSSKTTYQFTPSFKQISIPTTPQSQQYAQQIEKDLHISAFDLAILNHPEHNPDFLREIGKYAITADIIVSAHCYVYPAIQLSWRGHLAEDCPTQLIYDAHNVELQLKTQMLQAQNTADHPTAKRLLEMLKRTESALIQQANQVWVCSTQDQVLFHTFYQKNVHYKLVPNGVELPSYPPPSKEQAYKLRKTILEIKQDGEPYQQIAIFIGSLHQPNIKAAQHILKMAPKCPRTFFIIIGTVEKALNTEQISNNIWLTGRLEDSEKYLLMHIADIGLNPIEEGSGTNLKIVDYIAHHLLVLTTEIGNRGLCFKHQQHLIECKEVTQFEPYLKQENLGLTEIEANNMKQQAYQALKEKFLWEKIARRLI